MPLSLRRGTVTAILERHEGLVRCEVDGAPCVAYPRVTGPVALGDDVRALERETVAVGACFDGDQEAVNAASGLLACEADVIVCGIGPGIVGTGSRWGHGAAAAAEAANAASALGGRPILCARVSDADPRERHLGVSHHTRAALSLCLGDVVVAWPAG